jgi:hypothetical protein
MGNYIHQEIGGHDHGHHDDYDDLGEFEVLPNCFTKTTSTDKAPP